MSDFTDQQCLIALDGDQTCACCGIEPIAPEACDVVEGEVICLDCVATYYPQVYARRTGEEKEGEEE